MLVIAHGNCTARTGGNVWALINERKISENANSTTDVGERNWEQIKQQRGLKVSLFLNLRRLSLGRHPRHQVGLETSSSHLHWMRGLWSQGMQRGVKFNFNFFLFSPCKSILSEQNYNMSKQSIEHVQTKPQAIVLHLAKFYPDAKNRIQEWSWVRRQEYQQ